MLIILVLSSNNFHKRRFVLAMFSMEIRMKDKKMMFSIFQHHGSLTTSVYIKYFGTKYSKDEIIYITLRCLPHLDSLVFKPPRIVQKLHTVIGMKAEVFYQTKFEPPNFFFTETAFLSTVPLETYLNIAAKERSQMFFESMQMFDIMIGRVIAMSRPCYILSLLCFTNGKCRQIDDLDYRVHLPFRKVSGVISINDFIKVAIVGCMTKERRLYVSADEADLPEEFNGGNLPKLGLVTPDDFPSHYKLLLEGSDDSYDTFIKDEHFLYPHSLEKMLAAFGFNRTDVLSATNLGSRITYKPEEYATNIRDKQVQDLSKMHNEQGMDFVLKNKLADAINSFKKSIELSAYNIPALLQLGATYMSLKNYENAVEMLEKVLELQPNYEQAHLFLSKAVFCQARIALGQNDKEHAFECCKKAIKFNSNSAELHRKLMELLYEICADEEISIFATVEKQMLSSQTVVAANRHESDMEVEEAEENRIEVAPAPPLNEPTPPADEPPPPPPLPPSSPPPHTAADGNFTNRSKVEEAVLALKCNEFVKRIKLPGIGPITACKAEKPKSPKHPQHSAKKKKHKLLQRSGDKRAYLDNISSEEDDSIYSQAKELSKSHPLARCDDKDSRSRSPKAYSSKVNKERLSISSDRQMGTRGRRRQRSDSSSSSGFGRRRRRHSRSLSRDKYRSKRHHGRRSRSSSSDKYRARHRRTRSPSPDRYRTRRRRTRSPSLEWRSVSPRRSCEKNASFDLRHRLSEMRSPTSESRSKQNFSASTSSVESICLNDNNSDVSQDCETALGIEHFRSSSYVSSNKKPAINIINDILSKSS